MKIYYSETRGGPWTEITDLYWFEENNVHDFGGDGIYAQYYFLVEIPGVGTFDLTKP